MLSSTLEKLKDILRRVTKFTLTAQIKINNQQINPLATLILLLLGVAYLAKLLYKGVLVPIVYPFLRRLFYAILKRRSQLLSQPVKVSFGHGAKPDEARWVMIYGACSEVGKLVTKVFANCNYGLILIDANLAKLQDFKHELQQVFPSLCGRGTQDLIRIVNMNIGTDQNSTLIEYKLHNAVFGKDMPKQEAPLDEAEEGNLTKSGNYKTAIEGGQQDMESLKCPNVTTLVNCVGLSKDIRSFNEKMLHEMQLDQIRVSLGKQMLGFTMITNYFARIHAHLQSPCQIINFKHRVLMPWERYDNHLLLRVARVFMFPLTYHKQMDRINLIQLSANAYSEQLLKSIESAYPQLQTNQILLYSSQVDGLKHKDVQELLLGLRL